jgi:predicted dehydrogenase
MNSSSPVNVAVIGLGFMGVTHLKAYQKAQGARIAVVCDAVRQPDPQGFLGGVGGNVGTDDGVRLDINDTRYAARFEEVLADSSVDLIDICLPTAAHTACSIAALRAGKHVLCEKPLARNSAQAREIVAAAEAATTYFLPAMCMRFWPGWDWLKQTIAAGTFGQVLAARFRRVSTPPGWSKGTYLKGAESGGALLDLHIHDVDFVQHCFGRPQAVFAQGISRLSGAIDHVVAQYDFGNGVPVSAEGSWIMTEGFGFNMAFTVVMERATADYDLTRGSDALRLFEPSRPPRTLTPEGQDGYVGELQHMLDAIRSGHAPTRVTARDALSAVELCEAEESSIRSRQIVRLE